MAALSALERAAYIRLRNMQISRREAEVTWNQIVPVDTSLGPTLDMKYSKLDHKVDVKRWRAGNPRLGTVNVASGTGDVKLGFYGVEMTKSWWEQWLQDNMAREPNAAIFDQRGAFDMRRMEELAIAEIERTIEGDFYNGNADIGWDGMITLAGTPTSLATDLFTEAGRQEFIETIIATKVTAKNPGGDDRRVGGSLVLAIDSSAAAYLENLYDTTNGNPITAMDYLRKVVPSVVEVEHSAMADQAMLHWRDDENIVAFDGTPNGVVLSTPVNANRGEDAHSRIFTNIGFHEFRDGSVYLIDGLLPVSS